MDFVDNLLLGMWKYFSKYISNSPSRTNSDNIIFILAQLISKLTIKTIVTKNFNLDLIFLHILIIIKTKFLWFYSSKIMLMMVKLRHIWWLVWWGQVMLWSCWHCYIYLAYTTPDSWYIVHIKPLNNDIILFKPCRCNTNATAWKRSSEIGLTRSTQKTAVCQL